MKRYFLLKNPFFSTLYTKLLFKQQISIVFGGLLFFLHPILCQIKCSVCSIIQINIVKIY